MGSPSGNKLAPANRPSPSVDNDMLSPEGDVAGSDDACSSPAPAENEDLMTGPDIDGISPEPCNDVDDVRFISDTVSDAASDAVETAEEKKERFNRESARRFEKLPDYVDRKLREDREFPIKGNLCVAEYVRMYLEFLVKKHLIYSFLTEEEKDRIFSDENNPISTSNGTAGKKRINSIAKYFRDPCASLSYLAEFSQHPDPDDITGESPSIPSAGMIGQRGNEIADSMRIESGLNDIRDRITTEHASFFKRIPEFKLIDVGPAIGAISTMLALKVLDSYGLLSRTKITLVDISQRVLEKNKRGEYDIANEKFVARSFGSRDYFRMLKHHVVMASDTLCCAVEDGMPTLEDDSFDLALMCFFGHHVPDEYKQAAFDAVTRVTGGAICLADETKEAHEAFLRARAKDEPTDPAPEEPETLEISRGRFPNTTERTCTFAPGNLWYAHWRVKHPADDYGQHFNLNPEEEEDGGEE